MNQERTNRKLAAIFSTDVVGYSRMMEADEAWTIQNLEENKKLMGALIEEYKGRVVDSPGDNLLAEFGSVINAVECAVKIQKELNKKNSKLMEDHRMLFRIGVNLGDVVEEDGKIYGNGVNIAARLEGLAEPGGICISGTAYDQVKNKIEVDYDYLGEYQVKNINEPVRVYRILMGGESTEKYVPQGKSKKLINPLNIAITIIVLLLVALGTIITVFYPKPPEIKQVVRFTYELPEDQQIGALNAPVLAISPDGRQIVYKTEKGLYLHSMAELNAILIRGTEGNPESPFFSPDGQWIGYFSRSDGQLKKISINGGVPIPLATVTPYGFLKWRKDNTIIFAKNNKIMRISADGGEPEMLIEDETEGMTLLLAPQILPDEKTMMYTSVNYTRMGGASSEMIMMQSLKSGKKRELFPGYTAMYLPTGHIIYGVGNNIFSIPFDIKKLEVTGGKVPILQGILRIIGVPQYDISDSGTLVYMPVPYDGRSLDETEIADRTLVWVDRNGKEEPVAAERGLFMQPHISSDGSQIAVAMIKDKNIDIYVWNPTREKMTRLTFDPEEEDFPLWTPDSKGIVFYSTREGFCIRLKSADGTGKDDIIKKLTDSFAFPGTWASNGKKLLVDQCGSSKNLFIGALSMEKEAEIEPVLEGGYMYAQPRISPDGRWLAYTSNETGRNEIYVRPYPDVDSGSRWQISTEGGDSALWSPGGEELFYRNNENIMAVSVTTNPVFSKDNPKTLFQGNYIVANFNMGTLELSPWDINPDGKRFLMIKPSAESYGTFTIVPRKINIVLNWFEELKEKVPSH